jgi:hypothetical protein
MRGKRGALTVTFQLKKCATNSGFIFAGFPFWEYRSRFTKCHQCSDTALMAFAG